MKVLIYTFMALFIWTMIPIDALASRGDRFEHRTSYHKSSDDSRHGGRHDNRRRDSYSDRHAHNHRPEHWHGTTSRVHYVPYPVYRSYDVPRGYIFTSTPGVVLYFGW